MVFLPECHLLDFQSPMPHHGDIQALGSLVLEGLPVVEWRMVDRFSAVFLRPSLFICFCWNNLRSDRDCRRYQSISRCVRTYYDLGVYYGYIAEQ